MSAKKQPFFKSPLLGIALIISSSIIPISITPVMAGVTFKPPGAQAPQRSSGEAQGMIIFVDLERKSLIVHR